MIRPAGNANDFRLTALDNNGGDVVWGGAISTSIMRWTNAGNIGIGTTAPTSKLTLSGGNIEMKNSTAPSLLLTPTS